MAEAILSCIRRGQTVLLAFWSSTIGFESSTSGSLPGRGRIPIEGYMPPCRVIATATKPNYAAINSPLLIIAGSEDMTAPISGCDTILKKYLIEAERKKIEILGGIGHWHCIEAGDVVARHIKKFVIRTKACGS